MYWITGWILSKYGSGWSCRQLTNLTVFAWRGGGVVETGHVSTRRGVTPTTGSQTARRTAVLTSNLHRDLGLVRQSVFCDRELSASPRFQARASAMLPVCPSSASIVALVRTDTTNPVRGWPRTRRGSEPAVVCIAMTWTPMRPSERHCLF